MSNRKPLCVVPWVEGFSGYRSTYRNCCNADPEIKSSPDQTFEQWWVDPKLEEFRKTLADNVWPDSCYRCRYREEQAGNSFRTVVNQLVNLESLDHTWPSRWNVIFGNTCNLSCWSCSEQASSVIAEHKKRIGILPVDFVSPEEKFLRIWPNLKKNILKSYDHHDVVSLTILGGEPLVNQTVLSFLNELTQLGLSRRTNVEFHTNGTKFIPNVLERSLWNQLFVFLSIDAIGKKAEWLRYGCNWSTVEANIKLFQETASYTEAHCTLSVLNINDLAELNHFCQTVQLPLQISLLANPSFMSILNWSGSDNIVSNKDPAFSYYYDLLGSKNDSTSKDQLTQYIKQFGSIRTPLGSVDPTLAAAIGVG